MSLPAKNSRVVIDRVSGSGEPIAVQMLDNIGTPINLSGKTIKCRIVATEGGTVVVNNAGATISDAATGKAYYAPTADEIADMTAGSKYAVYFIDDDTIDYRYPYDGANYLLNIVSEFLVRA